MSRQLFLDVMNTVSPTLTSEQLSKFDRYHSLLLETNTQINLVSRKETDLWLRHFLNCALVAKWSDLNKHQVVDIGSGGGLPGIIMAILFPEAHITMVESIRKKAHAIGLFASEIGLSNTAVINSRIEEFPNHKKFDFITARAVGKIDDLLKWGNRLLKINGRYLLWKGRSYGTEISPPLKKKCLVHDLSKLHPSQDGVLLELRR